MGIIDSISATTLVEIDMTKAAVEGIFTLFSPQNLQTLLGTYSGEVVPDEARPLSPIGLAQAGNQIAEGGYVNLFTLLAFVNIFLAVFNSIPLVPLDGGRVVLALYEGITGKKIPKSIVVKRGKVGNYAAQLVQDVRRVMQPHTAMKLKERNSTIASLDIKKMYPPVRFSIIKKAITYYTSNLNPQEKKMIHNCLRMINFGMASCLITFNGKYFEYQGKGNNNNKGLAIGGYESAFLADLVASYLLEKTKKIFINTHYHGIYCNDGFVAFKGNQKIEELRNWLQKFQQSINKITGGTFLQFTMEVWDEFYVSNNDIKNDHNKTQKCTLVKKPTFPFLDMSFYWDSFNRLTTKAYSKPGQKSSMSTKIAPTEGHA